MADFVPTIVMALARQTLEQLSLTTEITHPGEGGRAREAIIRDFIRRLLPPALAIDTGFVIDGQGGRSRQIDIVVYRTDHHPILEIGEVKHFLVESVVLVAENKAKIGSKKVLSQALDNIASVKDLDRSDGGGNSVLSFDGKWEPYQPDSFPHQIFGVILTEHSMARKTLADAFAGFIRANPRRRWPNLYVDVNDFSLAYMRPNPDESAPSFWTCNTEVADRVAISKPGPESIWPLLELAQELANFVRISPLVDFSVTSYFYKGAGPYDVFTI